MEQRYSGDELEVVRALLLLQAAILVTTTIEAAILSTAFGTGPGPALVSAAATVLLLVARARLRTSTSSRRLVYVAEGILLGGLAVETVLARVLTGGAPPVMGLITRGLIPVAAIALLVREGRYGQSPLPDRP